MFYPAVNYNTELISALTFFFQLVRLASVQSYTDTHMQIFTHPQNEPTDKLAQCAQRDSKISLLTGLTSMWMCVSLTI